MPRSDEAESFFFAVYAAVQEIPAGRVTSYGHIAALVGMPQRPRQVGVCLKHLPEAQLDVADREPGVLGLGAAPRFHSDNVPWQRVLNAKGLISPRGGDGGLGRLRQAEALRAEGVEVSVNAGGLGEMAVDMARFGWFPRWLPSEEDERQHSDDDDGSDAGRVHNEAPETPAEPEVPETREHEEDDQQRAGRQKRRRRV